MNYYERIDKSINYIEHNIESPISIKNVAKEAFMSTSNLYRIFFALTGHTVKEYIRKRRIHLSIKDMKQNKGTQMNIAIKYDFANSDTFAKAFANIVGCNPTSFIKNKMNYKFEKIDILSKYYGTQEKDLLDKYPDIKVLKRLEPIKVACFEYFGKSPEINAFNHLLAWANNNNITIDNRKYRLFGHDTTECNAKDEYGYMACITIDDSSIYDTDNSNIKVKELSGGEYAVTTVNVRDIPNAWARFKSWIKFSKYELGTHQWFEEHQDGVNSDFNYDVDLYMPITSKSECNIEVIEDSYVVTCKVIGEEETAPYKAWQELLKWAVKNGISNTSKEHRFFAYHNYNVKRKGIKRWYTAMVTINEDTVIKDKQVKKENLVGGRFVTCCTDFKNLKNTWDSTINWIHFRGERINPKIKWREEWQVKDGKLYPEIYPKIKIYLSIK